MEYFDRLVDRDKKLYSTDFYSGEYDHNIYLVRAKDDDSLKPKFYIWATTNVNGVEEKQGYLYFYLDPINRTSSFIGTKVLDKYQGLNISSLLVSVWIDLCLNNGIDFLSSNEKQRKPFLIYLLKKFGFEIFDKNLYETSNDVISICRRDYDKSKLLLFKNDMHEKVFKGTNVFNTGNYEIIHSFDGVEHLDDIIMPLQHFKSKNINYNLMYYDKAKVKVKNVLKNHKK